MKYYVPNKNDVQANNLGKTINEKIMKILQIKRLVLRTNKFDKNTNFAKRNSF